MRKLLLLALATPGLGACDAPAVEANTGGAQVGEAGGAPRETVLRSETVEAVFTGWEVSDYVWANLKVKGSQESGAWVGPSPLEHFLEAHRGKPITVRIDTVRVAIPEAGGGEEEVRKIADASAGGTTAAQWWAGLSPEQKQAAEARMEDVLGGGA